MMNPCACMGKDYYGEPECPCRMESMGLPRSQKWHDEHTTEYLAEQRKLQLEAFAHLIEKRS